MGLVAVVAVGDTVLIPTADGLTEAIVFHTTQTTATARVGLYAWWYGTLDKVQQREQ